MIWTDHRPASWLLTDRSRKTHRNRGQALFTRTHARMHALGQFPFYEQWSESAEKNAEIRHERRAKSLMGKVIALESLQFFFFFAGWLMILICSHQGNSSSITCCGTKIYFIFQMTLQWSASIQRDIMFYFVCYFVNSLNSDMNSDNK